MHPVKAEKKEQCVKVCSDPNVPWIQKVDCLIQTWGFNKCVRLVFLCRICGKEQKSSLTGNWRNHFQVTHSVSQPITCDICNIKVKSKHSLNEHKKAFHKIQKESIIHSCQICQMPFQRKSDVKKHIAEKHSISLETETITNKDITNEIGPLLQQHSSKKQKLTVKLFPEQTDSSRKTKPPKVKPPPAATNRNLICKICYISFKTKAELTEHQDQIHFFDIHSSLKQIYKCTKCEDEFGRHIELLNHTIKMHGIQDTVAGATMIPDEAPTMSKTTSQENISLKNEIQVSTNVVTSFDSQERDECVDEDEEDDENLVVIIKEEEEDVDIIHDEKPRKI